MCTDRIQNKELRERALRLVTDGASWNELAYLCEVTKNERGQLRPDPSHLQRLLGVKPHAHSHRAPTYVTYAQAVQIARGLGLDPVDVGL